VRKLIVLGLDGLEPTLLEKYWSQGRCRHLRALADAGGYRLLATTTPAESPVAWSSFITGSNPGAHGIFDFLHRDPRTYLPRLSIAATRPPTRVVELGPWRLPLDRPKVIGGRKGTPFWHAVAAAGIPATVVRVPVTYPPEPFNGRLIASMGVPDIHGTQGTYQYWTTDEGAVGAGHGGDALRVRFDGASVDLPFKAIPDPFRSDARPVSIVARATRREDGLEIECDGHSFRLEPGEWSPWCKLTYRLSLAGRASGWVRFYLRSLEPEFNLYCSPVNVDPDRPSVPLSHPPRYASELKAAIGPYATLGMAEDTWVLNEARMDEDGFLAHCNGLISERTRMLEHELARFSEGLLVCVYDQPDRLQHMFWRVEDAGHPAHTPALAARYGRVLPDLYERLDDIVGLVRQRHPEADLMVMSDHGCKSFRRAFHVNRWLADNGYLTIDAASGAEGDRLDFAGVDWPRTRAYAIGLVGLFINLRGREGRGSVTFGSTADALKAELIAKLEALVDPATGVRAINRVLTREFAFRGPEVPDAPDLVLAYNAGYRASWQTALGGIPAPVFEDNTMAWSGDHCIDASLVPGVLLSTLPLTTTAPHIMDIAPSVLRYFGRPADPAHEGRGFWEA
jgi:predicted AlkP superfamily phosphohydrolase/phosphomutase